MPSAGPGVDIQPWAQFRSRWKWEKGEHVTLVGHTGSGKSTLALSLLIPRTPAVFLATKPRDATMDKLKEVGWVTSKTWPPPPRTKQVILHPRIRKIEDMAHQQQVMTEALGYLYAKGGWTIFADELRYITDQLRLKKYCELLWLQGRSLGISFMTATQRPFWVPLEAWSQSTHVFLWKENDKRNLDRLVEIGGVDTAAVKRIVPRLGLYSCLYVNTRTGRLIVTRPPGTIATPDRH